MYEQHLSELPKPRVSLRPAIESDVDEFVAWPEEITDEVREDMRKDLVEMLESPDVKLTTVECESKVCGYLILEDDELPYEVEVLDVIKPGDTNPTAEELSSIFNNPDKHTLWTSVNTIDIRTSERGKGYGQEAIQQVVDDCRHRGIELVTFHTQPENFAMQRVGEKLGFTLAKVPSVKGADGKPVDEEGAIFAIKIL